MGKTVYKLRPSNHWSIGKHESWFTDMAARGLHLQKVGLHFAKFVKGEPRQIKYRIDVEECFDNKVNPDKVQIYKESGWDYINSYAGYFHVFSVPEEIHTTEIHTDPAEQAHTLKSLDKKLKFEAIITAVLVPLFFGMFYSIFFLYGTPTLVLVEGRSTPTIGLAIMNLFLLSRSVSAYLSIRKLRNSLAEGRPVNHSENWKRSVTQKTITLALPIIIFTTVYITPFIQIHKSTIETLPPLTPNLPIVRLADIEQNSQLEFSDGNYYTHEWSFLAPIQYESYERGYIDSQTWMNSRDLYSPVVITRMYQLRLSYLNEKLIYDLIKRYDFPQDNGGDYIKTTHPSFDLLIVHESDESKVIFAAKGRAVMHVRYYGNADISTVIDEVADKISLISK